MSLVFSVPKQALGVCVVTSLLVTITMNKLFCLKAPLLSLLIISKSVFSQPPSKKGLPLFDWEMSVGHVNMVGFKLCLLSASKKN